MLHAQPITDVQESSKFNAQQARILKPAQRPAFLVQQVISALPMEEVDRVVQLVNGALLEQQLVLTVMQDLSVEILLNLQCDVLKAPK